MIDIYRLLNLISNGSIVSHKGFKIGDNIKNINKNCTHYGTIGKVTNIEKLADDAGFLVVYKITEDSNNNGYFLGQTVKKTEDQIQKI